MLGSGPGGSYLGSDMRAAYYGGTTLNGNGQVIGILEFGGYSLSDVNLTFSNAGQTYQVPINNVLLDGASGGSTGSDGEEVLDIVQAIGMAPGLSQVRVYIGYGLDDPSVLNSMASENIAKQLSCSWGWRPADPSQVDDVFFQEMAAQGQSFFTASGDSGAFDAAVNPFFYPGDDQYVTAVGGTHLTTTAAGGSWVSETVWNSSGGGSGGGISPDGITMPSWQAGLATSANGGSTTLRNVPDVAMEGDFDNYACSLGSCAGDWAGTSFAAPRWAGFMALVNQQAVESGNAPSGGLGFVNPAIYQLAQASATSADFHDITVGNNDTANQPLWFSAEVGYDLTTGWGSANGQQLINDLAGPQVPGFWLASSQSSVGVSPGGTSTTTVNVTNAGGFSGSVNLAVTSALPTGVTASFSPNPTATSSVLTLTATSAAPSATQTVVLTGTSGSISASTNITVAVHAPTFNLFASPSSLGINQGATGTSTIYVQSLYGFTGAVNLSVAGLPSGVTAVFSPISSSGTSTLTLTVGSSAAPATSTLTITGTSGTLTSTTTVALSVHGPSFTLTSVGTVNMGQGTSSAATVYVNDQYGFTGSVNLSVSDLPSGVTASFSANPTTGLSNLTFVASSSATPGQTVVTITGTSGSLTATTTLNLGVFVPTFTLSSSGLNLGQGSSSNTNVYVTDQYGFNGIVTFTVSGLPAGVTASFSPNPTTTYSAVTFTATNTASVGQSVVTITGTSGSITATTTINLGVFAPTFTLSGGGSVGVGQGTSTGTYIYVNNQYGFTGSVNLSVSGLPSGVTASFSLNPTTSQSVLTFTASSSANIGHTPVTITGTYGSITSSVNIDLGVYAPTFTLNGGGIVSIGQGSSGSTYVSVNNLYGFTGSVNLAVSGLPSGVTASFSPNPTTGSSLLTFTASSSAAVGQVVVTITGTSGSATATTTVTLGVYDPSFTLSCTGAVNIGQGTSGTATVVLNNLYGFTGSVNLAVSGLPAGVAASFSPNPTTGSSILTFTASSLASLGNSVVTITGTSGSVTATTTISLGVYVPTFTLSGGGSLSIGPGKLREQRTFMSTPQYGFTGNVTLSISGLPTGVTPLWTPNPTNGTSILTLTASNSVPVGQYNLTITGVYGSTTKTTTLTLNINAPAFTITTYSSVSLGQGASGTASFQVNPQYGFTGNVTMSVSGLPSGVTASFSPNPASANTTLTLTASSTAAPGQYTLTITGTSGTQSATALLGLTVYVPSFTVSSSRSFTVGQGGSTSGYFLCDPPVLASPGTSPCPSPASPSGVTASFSS